MCVQNLLKNAECVISVPQSIFVRHGIPNTFMADSIPYFTRT